MPGRSMSSQQQSVTRAEFETLSQHVDQRFNALTSAIREISVKLDDRDRPQYGLLVSIFGLIITLCGGAWILIHSQIEAAEKLSTSRDQSLQVSIDQMQYGNNRWTMDDHREYERDQELERKSIVTSVDALRTSVVSNNGDIRRIDAQLQTWIADSQQRDQGILETRDKVARLEAVLPLLVHHVQRDEVTSAKLLDGRSDP